MKGMQSGILRLDPNISKLEIAGGLNRQAGWGREE